MVGVELREVQADVFLVKADLRNIGAQGRKDFFLVARSDVGVRTDQDDVFGEKAGPESLGVDVWKFGFVVAWVGVGFREIKVGGSK